MLLSRDYQQIYSPRVLVYLSVEGEKREKLYFEAVARLLEAEGTSPFRLETDAEPGKSSPDQVIDRAKAFYRLHTYTNRVWLVMDADRGYLEQIEGRRGEIETLGFMLGISNPCFELWLRLHERDCDPSLTDASSYKAVNTFDLNTWGKEARRDGINHAVRRAEALPGSAATPFPGNPGTQLAALFRYLGFGG